MRDNKYHKTVILNYKMINANKFLFILNIFYIFYKCEIKILTIKFINVQNIKIL